MKLYPCFGALLVAAALVLALATTSAQTAPGAAAAPAAPPAGRGAARGGGPVGGPVGNINATTASLFMATCAGCHGTGLEGGRAKSLFNKEWLATVDDAHLT